MSFARPARSFALAALVLFAPAAAGCGYLKANFAQTYVWTRELDAYVIQKPVEEALAKAVTVKGPNNILFYHGQSTFTDVSPTLKRSGPHEETSPGGGDKTTSVSVIEIEGFPKPTGCQVHVTEIVESTTRRNGQIVSTQTSRDRRADLEIEIVGMFDPQTAARILREGEEARASGEWYPPKKK